MLRVVPRVADDSEDVELKNPASSYGYKERQDDEMHSSVVQVVNGSRAVMNESEFT